MGVITQKIGLGMMIKREEWDVFVSLIWEKYSQIPKINKLPFFKDDKQIYKNVQIIFDKTDRDAALYSFLFFEFSKKRPKCYV